MSAEPQLSDHTDVRIRGPLPLDVASTLLQVIDRVYPGTKVTTARGDDALHLLIPVGERPVCPDLDEGLPVEVIKLNPDGMTVSTPQGLATMLTGIMEDAFAEHEADNYVEWSTRVPASEGHRQYVMTFARSQQQTPAELRTKAERELAEAREVTDDMVERAALADTNAALAQRGIAPVKSLEELVPLLGHDGPKRLRYTQRAALAAALGGAGGE